MNVRAMVTVAAVSFASSACVSPLQGRVYSRIPLPRPELVHVPSTNAEAEAEIGVSMVSSARRTSCPGIKLSETIVHDGTHYGRPYRLTIPAGSLHAAANDQGGTFYEVGVPIEFRGSDGSTMKVFGGIFVPSASPTATEVYWLATNAPGIPLNDAHPGIMFERGIVDIWGSESFKRELVYGGVSENTIAILYREFVNDMARPAFSQELKYDLSKGDVIGYRGARFQVIKVTNTGIRYKVLAHLQ